MGDVVDIDENLPHEVAELMCWNCGSRWIAVYNARCKLSELECPKCHKAGGAFKTGQTFDLEDDQG